MILSPFLYFFVYSGARNSFLNIALAQKNPLLIIEIFSCNYYSVYFYEKKLLAASSIISFCTFIFFFLLAQLITLKKNHTNL